MFLGLACGILKDLLTQNKFITEELFAKYFYITIIQETFKQSQIKFTLRKPSLKKACVWRSNDMFLLIYS